MPHCILEYAKEIKSQIDMKELIAVVHDGIKRSAVFDIGKLKIRAIPYEDYSLVEADLFIHVSLRILAGRDSKTKKILAEDILNELKLMPLMSVSLTVEICDIDSDSYSKYLVP